LDYILYPLRTEFRCVISNFKDFQTKFSTLS
jgi:hypothetical protein